MITFLLALAGVIGLVLPEYFQGQTAVSIVLLAAAAIIFIVQMIAIIYIRKKQKEFGIDPLEFFKDRRL